MALLSQCAKKGKNNPDACNGNTRREVKILIDAASSEIDTVPIVTTIVDMGLIEVPDDVDSDTKRLDIEKQVYTVTGTVDKIKRYRDGDYHIKLVDDNENYIITEAANPGCTYVEESNFLQTFKDIEAFIEANDIEEGQVITITGVAFVDIDHYYKRDQAANNMELHPILKIEL
jgi:hypothetical protein